MNAEAGNEPESPKKRGRIPQSAWPQILERYRAGATLSAIAREFSCTPSAISYIVRKAEASGVEPVAEEAETQAPDATEEKAEMDTVPAARASADARPSDAPLEKTVATAAVPPAAASVPAPAKTAAPVEMVVTKADPVAKAETAAAPRVVARPEPTPPVDETEGRLRETAKTCLLTYRGWKQTPGETSIQALSDAVHELRKVLARIEIDMSASRREEQAIRPIPIPAHRAARRPS